jgi:uncharacterized membrane protein YedE/YeeE
MYSLIMTLIIALISGLLFGLGMMVSGMVIPENVIGFLDITGAWNPDLAFVMGSALLVFAPVYFKVIKPRKKPVLSEDFHISTKTHIDSKLIGGAIIFGIGWGIAGICPGPAITSLSGLNYSIIAFVLSMFAGIKLACYWVDKRESGKLGQQVQ